MIGRISVYLSKIKYKNMDFRWKEEDKLPLNKSFVLFISVLSFVWCESFFRFLFSMTSNGNVEQGRFCFIAGGIVFCLMGMIAFRRVTFHTVPLYWIDLIVVLYGTMLFALSFPFPDSSFDTVAYGLYLQENSFVDVAHTQISFFDKAYLLNLIEREFNYLRQVFGYRYAIIANWFCFLVTYIKVKEILLLFTKNKLKENKFYEELILPAASAAIILTEFFVFGMQIMKPDLFIIPIVLESLRVIYVTKEMKSIGYLYLSVLIGLGTSLKVINAIYFIPMVLWAITKYIKKAKWKDYICAVCPAIMIVSIYVIYNYTCVENPTYPFYNHIFKGGYTSLDYTGIYLRWGPKSLKEWLLWPLIVFLNPERYGELPCNSGRGLIGAFICLVTFGYAVYIKSKKQIFVNLIAIIYTLLFNKMFGYCRYGILVEIILGCCVVMNLLFLFEEKNKKKRFPGILFNLFFIMFAAQILYSQLIVTSANLGWTNDQSIALFASDRNYALKNWIDNFKLVFHDKGNVLGENAQEIETELEKVELWIDTGSGYTSILNPEADFCYFNAAATVEMNQNTVKDLYKQYAGNENIYGILNSVLGQEFAYKRFEELGFQIEKIIEFHVDFLDPNQTISLCKLRFK